MALKIYAIIDALVIKQFYVCKGNSKVKMIPLEKYAEIQKTEVHPMV